MVSTDVKTAIYTASAAVLALTLAGAAAAMVDPALAGRTRPHPTLTGSLGDYLSILATNLRVLAVPFILAALRFPTTRLGRTTGDLILTALTALSTLAVGIALGRWQQRLIAYLPHLPLEWAALSLSLAAWLLIRTRRATARQLFGLAAVIAGLLIAAAALETWATPRRDGSSISSVRAIPRRSGIDGAPRRMPAQAPAEDAHTINPRPPGGIT